MLADMPFAGKPIFFHEDAIKIKSFGLRTSSTEELSRFVGELMGISDLYLSSEDESFLICINHHGFIICTRESKRLDCKDAPELTTDTRLIMLTNGAKIIHRYPDA